jgi:catechol 2,3-dioxygenase-like lactoylglutathione lyase family enzyme
MIAAFLLPLGSMQQVKAQAPGIVGLDHVGFNVPDLDQAVKFFSEVLGFHKVYEEGKLPLNADAKKAFNIRQSAEITRIAMLETGGGSNIELFEYSSPQRNMKRPMNDDIGWYHFAVYTSNMEQSVAYLKSKGVHLIGNPIEHKTGPNAGLTGVYFETPWGLQIELVTYPKGMAYEKAHPKYKLWSPKNNKDEK